MFRLRLLASLLALIVLVACDGAAPLPVADEDAPNVILIISDDHSWNYFGFMGSRIVQTPNLDRLAAQGVVYPRGFSTASVCRPALNSLLTGLHPIQWEARNEQLERQGVERVPILREIDSFETLPKMLAKKGYRSFQGGKYWEGSFEQGGFDVGLKGFEKGYANNPTQELAGGDGLALGRETLQPLWDFIDEESDKPFFVWYAPMLPHKPHDAPEKFMKLYDKAGLHIDAKKYYAAISWLDDGVGKILDHLEKQSLRRETLVFFLTDNGYEQPPGERVAFRGGERGKTSIREMGFRTPVIASWPGKIRAGRSSDALVSIVDVFTTIADYAGAEAPSDRDGMSLRPYLERGEEVGRERVVVGNFDIARLPAYVTAKTPHLGEKQNAYAIRSDRWRYVWFMDADVEELYEIERDPMETRNVIASHPELASQLKGELEAWLQAMRAPYVE